MHPGQIILLTLMPWAAAWLGVNSCKSMVASFALYHGACLLPWVIARREVWLKSLKKPKAVHLIVIGIFAVLLPFLAFETTRAIGGMVVDRSDVLAKLAERGFNKDHLLVLTLYFVLVNATLEELFWRGVILAETERFNKGKLRLGSMWTAIAFACWHYVVFRMLLKPGIAELMILCLMLTGALFEWLYRRTGTLISPILWHMIFDLAVIFVLIALL